jgi:hypothetical protein
MRTFSVRLGFALFYEATKTVVPPSGGVGARWFSNVDAWERKLPHKLFDLLLPPSTLRQGSFDVEEQFTYAWRVLDDQSMGVFFSTFRKSFSVVSYASVDAARFERHGVEIGRIVRPGQLKFLTEES